MNKVITLSNVSKVYKLYDRPGNRLKEFILKRPFHKEFVALDGISFDLGPGETLGIIGENGAGKSTLLKILAKTLSPTTGTVGIHGKVSSLLELGSGFHSEFTGMENIYFYGALLGLSTAELSKKVDEILDFAEIGEFINYPLKIYSSGMYVRLAFAVATAIDPDVLIVDEALSVGDLYFQKKSINKILSFKERGKTIVFCSHAIYYISQLCKKVLWLKNGRTEMLGNHYDVTQAYEDYQLERKGESSESSGVTGTSEDTLMKPIIIDSVQPFPFPSLRTGDDLRVRIGIKTQDSSVAYTIGVIIKRIDGLDIASTYPRETQPLCGDRELELELPAVPLKAGTYFARVYALDEHLLHIYDTKDSLPFTIPKESIEIGLIELPNRWSIGPAKRSEGLSQ